MMETEGRTINITIDEYFDLRTKAAMNIYLMERFGEIDGQLRDIDHRLFDLERTKARLTHETD